MINISIFNIVFIASEWNVRYIEDFTGYCVHLYNFIDFYSYKVDLKLIAFVSMLVLGRLRYGALEYDFDVQ